MANNSKYLDYAGLQRLVENINKKYAPIQAVRFVSTVEDIDSLPALNTVKAGWMYNIKTGGLTTDDFVEGAGHIVADGENIGAVELLTGVYTPVASPAATDDPKALEWYEVDTTSYVEATDIQVGDDVTGLYEEDSLNPGTYIPTTDSTAQAGKTYYRQVVTYKLSQDRMPEAGKTYYEAGKEMKWDLMGGTFDLEGRYLEFGDEFPQKPDSKMVDGRTFLFMGDDVKLYTLVASPEGRPTENGYFEGVFTVASTADVVNPKQVPLYEKTEHYNAVTPAGTEDPSALGWYEEDPVGSETYVLTADTTVTAGKTYYTKGADTYARTNDSEVMLGKTYYTGAFTASTDTSVDPAKQYYTEEVLYKKGGIYEYDATNKEWVLQSSGGADVEAIPLKDIDDLFI